MGGKANPAALGFRLPAEWEPQAAVWLSWPHNLATWPAHFRMIPAKFAEIVARISRYEEVRINVADPLQQRLGNFAADRASREQVLGTINLGRLGQDRRAAVAYDEVAGPSQGWVGGDAAVAIGAAAVQRHDQSTQRLG